MRKFLLMLLLLSGLPGALLAAPAPAPASLDLSAYAGKVVYVDFWASWCVPCRKSFPWLNELASRYPQDLVVVGVNVDAQRADADRFLAKYPATFPLVFDPQGRIAADYRLEGMPSAVLVGRDGRVVHRHVGFREDHRGDYEQVVRELLARH